MSTSNKKLDYFANRVRGLRDSLRLTQGELAKKLGVSRNYIYLIESGRSPGRKFVEKVSELERESEILVREDTGETGSGHRATSVTRYEIDPSSELGVLMHARLAERLRSEARQLRETCALQLAQAERLEKEALDLEGRRDIRPQVQETP